VGGRRRCRLNEYNDFRQTDVEASRLESVGEAARWFKLTNTFWEACMRLVKAYAIQS
jgi:hypothetical protein